MPQSTALWWAETSPDKKREIMEVSGHVVPSMLLRTNSVVHRPNKWQLSRPDWFSLYTIARSPEVDTRRKFGDSEEIWRTERRASSLRWEVTFELIGLTYRQRLCEKACLSESDPGNMSCPHCTDSKCHAQDWSTDGRSIVIDDTTSRTRKMD
jgi:hypothetical protein